MPSTHTNTFYYTTAAVGQKIISFFYFTIVARSLGVENTGVYIFALTFTSIFSVLSDFGISPTINREIAKNPDNAQKIFSNALGLKLPFLALSFIFVTAAINFWGATEQVEKLVLISSITMLLDAIHLLNYAVFRGLKDLRFESVGVVLSQLITLIIGTIALALELPILFLILAFTAGSLFNVIFSSYFLFRKHSIYFKPAFDLQYSKLFFKISVAFGISGIFSRIFSSIDSVLLSKLSGNSTLGLYSVPNKIAFAFQFVPLALVAAIFPAMSHSYAKKTGGISRIFIESIRYLSFVSFPIAAGIISLGPEIINNIYGNSFASSVIPLYVLMVSLIFAFLGFPVGSVLNATDRQVIQTKLMGAAVTVNILLNLILIPRFSAVGAAISALCSYIFLTLGGYYFASKIIEINKIKIIEIIAKSFFSAGLMIIFVLLLKQFILWWLVIPFAAIIYIAAALAIKLISIDDIKFGIKNISQ